MFRHILRETALVNDKADAFFGERVHGESYNGDMTLVSTLRALIYPRMGESDKLFVMMKHSSGNSDSLSSPFSYLNELGENCGYFVVHSLNGSDGDTSDMIQKIDHGFTQEFSGFVNIPKISEFYKSFSVRCFVNAERKITLMIVDRMDTRKLHYIQAAILPALPWYYDPSKGVLPEELTLLNSFREKESQTYVDIVEVIAGKYDFRTPWLRSKLDGFETIAEREEIRRLDREISNARQLIAETQQALGNRIKELDLLIARHYGLTWCVTEGGNTELRDYLLCDKNIYVDNVEGSCLYFTSSGYLTNFDDDQAESVINNAASFMYQSDCGYSHEQMKKFYTAVFLDKTLKLRFCAGYSMDIADRSVRAMNDYRFATELANHMPNPHINRYSCMGNYSRVIGECFSEHNYIGVLQQCTASCVSLNFSDGTVMREFANKVLSLEYAEKRFVTLPDGTNVTHGEAIAWLEQEESTNEQTEEEA